MFLFPCKTPLFLNRTVFGIPKVFGTGPKLRIVPLIQDPDPDLFSVAFKAPKRIFLSVSTFTQPLRLGVTSY